MNHLAIAVLACGCSATPVKGFFEHEIRSLEDPEVLADLRTVGDAQACVFDCDSADRDRSHGFEYATYKSSLTPPGRLAACIVTTATFRPPTRDELSLHLQTYLPFKSDPQDRTTDLCNICVPASGEPVPAALVPLQDKYFARCAAQAADLLTRTLEAELEVEVGAARSARDHDHVSFGDKLNYVELKLVRIDELGRDPGFVARARADLGELRYGVYGPTAMRSAFERQPAVAVARKELDRIDVELKSLNQRTPTDADAARLANFVHRSEQLRAAIATEEAKYSFAATDVRVKAYESAPETMRIKDRLSAVKSELARAAEVTDIARTDALAAEQKQLEAKLATLRTQYEISWSIY